MAADLLPSIRATLVAASGVTDELPAYAGSYPIFTRRPVPDDAQFPMVVVNPQVQAGEADGLTDQRPDVVHDVIVYGRNGVDGGTDHYRAVERAAHAIQQLFHRDRTTISATGWSVVDVTASGPFPAPVDDQQTVGRRVELTARLARAN